MKRSVKRITGEMYTAEERTADHGWKYTEVCNYGEFQFRVHGHGYTDEQMTAIVLVYRDGVQSGDRQGRKELASELRELLGVTAAVQS